MLRKVQSGLRGQRSIAARVDGVTATAVLSEGTGAVTLTDTGTGDYLLTFNERFVRVPSVVATTLTALTRAQIGTVSATSVQILTFGYNNTTATDAVVHVFLTGWDVAL